MRGDTGFPGTSRAGDQDAASPEVAFTTEHVVQRGNARRYPLVRGGMLQFNRCYRQDRDTVLVDEERVLARTVRRASVLDNAQTPGENGFRHPVIEQDDTIGDVLFQAMARETILAALAGDHGSEFPVFEPTK